LDVGTGLLSPLSYKPCNAEFYIGLNPTYTYWSLQRRVISQWFHSLRQLAVKTFVGGTCAPPSALLVFYSLEHFLKRLLSPSSPNWSTRCTLCLECLEKKSSFFSFMFAIKFYGQNNPFLITFSEAARLLEPLYRNGTAF